MSTFRGQGSPISGDPYPTPDELSDAVDEANAAAANASNSASSANSDATAAATSASNAATSETNAATSESNAATSESNAATSESNAATSASNASTSESNAAASAAAAATSASSISNHNMLMNGEFRLAQSGSTFVAAPSNQLIADRWKYYKVGTGVCTTSLPTAPSGQTFENYVQFDVTTADAAVAAGDFQLMLQSIEGYDTVNLGWGDSGAEDITLSFLHAHTRTGTYCISITNNATNRSYVAEYTHSVSDAWEETEITIPGDTTGTWLKDNSAGIIVRFSMMAGTTFQTTAGSWQAGNFHATSNQTNAFFSATNFCRFANVKVERGSNKTTYIPRALADELNMVERFIEKSYDLTTNPASVTTNGVVTVDFYGATGLRRFHVAFKTKKRAPATISKWDDNGGANLIRDDIGTTYALNGPFFSGDNGFIVEWNNTGGSFGKFHYLAISEIS